jgi:hypothetical protein
MVKGAAITIYRVENGYLVRNLNQEFLRDTESAMVFQALGGVYDEPSDGPVSLVSFIKSHFGEKKP